MSKRRIVALSVLTLFIAFLVYAAIKVRNHGFSAREEPTWYEKILARNARKLAFPAGAKELKNPVAYSEAGREEAEQHFLEHCSMCHGLKGKGDTTIGRNLYPKAADLTDAQTQELTDGEIYYIINNGIRFAGMPAFGVEDSEESLWQLVAYIRELPKLPVEETTEDAQPPDENTEEADGEGTQNSVKEQPAAPKPGKKKRRSSPTVPKKQDRRQHQH